MQTSLCFFGTEGLRDWAGQKSLSIELVERTFFLWLHTVSLLCSDISLDGPSSDVSPDFLL